MQVLSIAEMGAYVRLLEYDNIEGMILLSELSRRRIRSITKLIKACIICHYVLFRLDSTIETRQNCVHLCVILITTAHAVGWTPGASHGSTCRQEQGIHRFVKTVCTGATFKLYLENYIGVLK